MANLFIPRSRGSFLNESVSVFLENGDVFHGWEDVSVTKNLGSIANSFQFSYDDVFSEKNLPWPLKPGVKVDINIGEEPVISGRIDRLEASFSGRNRSVIVAGRSSPGDLVDTSVIAPFKYTNIRLDRLAEALIKPFGLKVFLSVDPKIIDEFALKPGETIFTALDRAARTQGFFWVSTREGNIRLTRAGRQSSVSEIHQDFNMLSASISFDNSDRFASYKVIGQTKGSDEFSGLNSSSPSGVATDNAIRAARTLTIIAESNINSEQAAERAGWEASHRIAEAMEIRTSVQGWRQEDGSLWGINQRIRIKSKFLGVDGEFLSSSVKHIQSDGGGTTTDITLVRKDSFTSQPQFKNEDDPLSFLGL